MEKWRLESVKIKFTPGQVKRDQFFFQTYLFTQMFVEPNFFWIKHFLTQNFIKHNIFWYQRFTNNFLDSNFSDTIFRTQIFFLDKLWLKSCKLDHEVSWFWTWLPLSHQPLGQNSYLKEPNILGMSKRLLVSFWNRSGECLERLDKERICQIRSGSSRTSRDR